MYDYKRINDKLEEAYSASADQFVLKIKKGTVTNLIRLTLQCLQDGATQPTTSDFLAQLGTTIEIAIGNKVIQSFTPAEYYEYILRKLDITGIGFITDGTGADNHFAQFMLPIFLCPQDKEAIDFMNPDYGFDGSKEVNITITYPADANEIDTRLLTLDSISIPKSTPSKVMEFEEITKTFGSTGKDQELGLSQNTLKKLYEIFIKETSYMSEGATTDQSTIREIAYQESNEDVHFHDMRLDHLTDFIYLSGAETTGDILVDDQYKILPFHHQNSAENSLPLAGTSRLVVNVITAEALTYTQLRIAPLSIFSQQS